MSEKCACKGAFLEKFIQPAILLLLYDESQHGFSIHKNLTESDSMDFSCLDPTGIYRMLKKMEGNGLITSSWDTGNSAQARRMFTITDQGRECLHSWRNTLASYKDDITKLVDAISARVEED